METPPIRPPQQQALNVTPLNSMPYIDTLASPGNDSPLDLQGDTEPTEKANPTVVYFPCQPSEVELNNVLSFTRGGVVLGGSAAVGAIGPFIGKMDIAESEDSYVFCVSLPGVPEDKFSFSLESDGQVLMKGVTTTGEKTVYKHSMKFEMLTQNLSPPGHFSLSFKLPGPIDPDHFNGEISDGIFHGLIKKKTQPN